MCFVACRSECAAVSALLSNNVLICQDLVINALALLHVFIIQAFKKHLIHYLWTCEWSAWLKAESNLKLHTGRWSAENQNSNIVSYRILKITSAAISLKKKLANKILNLPCNVIFKFVHSKIHILRWRLIEFIKITVAGFKQNSVLHRRNTDSCRETPT